MSVVSSAFRKFHEPSPTAPHEFAGIDTTGRIHHVDYKADRILQIKDGEIKFIVDLTEPTTAGDDPDPVQEAKDYRAKVGEKYGWEVEGQ